MNLPLLAFPHPNPLPNIEGEMTLTLPSPEGRGCDAVLPLSYWHSRQPLLTQFTLAALQQERLAHAFLLKGADATGAYRWFLSLAATLNCLQPTTSPQGHTEPCGHCQPCLWLAKNAHPHVMTLTRLTCLPPDDEKDKNKVRKTISTEQITALTNELMYANQGWRLVWLSDAHVRPKRFADPDLLPPNDWAALAKPDTCLELAPLNANVLSDKAVNQLLKTLEAPPPRTLFVFYTDSEQSVLPTIVSRCQVLPLQAKPVAAQAHLSPQQEALHKAGIAPDHAEWMASFWHRWMSEATTDPFPLLEATKTYWEDEQRLPWPQVMDLWQQWLHALWPLGELGLTHQRYTQLHTKLSIAKRWFEQKTNTNATLWWVLAAPLTRQQWG